MNLEKKEIVLFSPETSRIYKTKPLAIKERKIRKFNQFFYVFIFLFSISFLMFFFILWFFLSFFVLIEFLVFLIISTLFPLLLIFFTFNFLRIIQFKKAIRRGESLEEDLRQELFSRLKNIKKIERLKKKENSSNKTYRFKKCSFCGKNNLKRRETDIYEKITSEGKIKKIIRCKECFEQGKR